jgi:hypothetical protein
MELEEAPVMMMVMTLDIKHRKPDIKHRKVAIKTHYQPNNKE